MVKFNKRNIDLRYLTREMCRFVKIHKQRVTKRRRNIETGHNNKARWPMRVTTETNTTFFGSRTPCRPLVTALLRKQSQISICHNIFAHRK